jgi:hypothetical protein
MPTIIDGSGSATFQTPLPLAQGGNGNTTGNVVSSQVADAFNATGSAPIYACRAWISHNSSTLQASGNISSLTRNSVGNYTVAFATAMPDANYAPVYMGEAGRIITKTASSFNYARILDNGAGDDGPVGLGFFR